MRRQLLVDMRRKYGDTIAEVVSYGREARVRLDELVGLEARAATLDTDREMARQALVAAQNAVRAVREAAAPKLAKKVQAVLRTLAMPHVVVGVDVDGDAGDKVSFTIAANPGTPPQPLNKVASGGELARTMLSLRLVLGAGPSAWCSTRWTPESEVRQLWPSPAPSPSWGRRSKSSSSRIWHKWLQVRRPTCT